MSNGYFTFMTHNKIFEMQSHKIKFLQDVSTLEDAVKRWGWQLSIPAAQTAKSEQFHPCFRTQSDSRCLHTECCRCDPNNKLWCQWYFITTKYQSHPIFSAFFTRWINGQNILPLLRTQWPLLLRTLQQWLSMLFS